MEEVRAIDLGNPEMYDTRWILERCAATNTVLYSRLAAEPDEYWESYTRRIAALARETGARVILLFRFTIIWERFMVIIWKKRAEGIRIIREGVETG
jgi:hypothetical protein